jgi:hypothetical protein
MHGHPLGDQAAEERAGDIVGVRASPPHGQEEHPDRREERGGGRAIADLKPPHRDGRYRPRLLFRLEQAGLIEGIATHPIGSSQYQRRCERQEPSHHPRPHGHPLPEERASHQAGPEGCARDRQDPGSHAVT